MSTVNVLVLCTGNSARSIVGEALLNRLGTDRVRAFSAGSRPTGEIHPGAIRLLTREGFALDPFRSKSWTEFTLPGAPSMDVVITVCGNAAGEACPAFPGRAVRAHWGLPDPADVVGDEGTQDAAFERTYAALHRRVEAFLALPFETMSADEMSRELNAIGALEPVA